MRGKNLKQLDVFMRTVMKNLLSLTIIITSFVAFGSMSVNALGSSFVEVNGVLTTVGNKVCNQYGCPIQLRGMSSHGVCWYGSFINASCITWLRDDWKINCFRIAMYLKGYNCQGYLDDPSGNMRKVQEGIDACIDAGIYVIVDWHIANDCGDPYEYRDEAKYFFQTIASKYKDYPNIIYEICNEPNGDTVTWDVIKQYAEYVIDAIREVDTDSFILVGTPTWSQRVDLAAEKPLDPSKYPNIAYVCHFYADSHKDENRTMVTDCLNKDCPVFVSEWGTCNYQGTSTVNKDESQKWLDLLQNNKISHLNWSLSDINDNSLAALKAGASATGDWPASDLSESGIYVREKLISYSGDENLILSPTSQAFSSGGGTGSVEITPLPCYDSWTAASTANWITVTSGGSGTGTGTVVYSVSASASARTGFLTIAGQTFTVTQRGTGNLVTDTLWIRAVINTVEKGHIDAVWQKGGESITVRGDRVIWGHFYASPSDVTWGSKENPDLYVKIWFDVSGRIDVNYFHVSVPDITVYTDYPYNGSVGVQGTTTMSRRYIRHYFQGGTAFSEENYEDGIAATGYNPSGNPAGYMTLNNLGIGSLINTVEKGLINGVWRLGGKDKTARGDQVVWGFYYASPSDVSWGSRNNPDLYVKIWFDVSGRIDVNCFHVSVPDIEVYSDYPVEGVYNQKGTTTMNDRYIRHEFWKSSK